jgi:Transposase
MAKLLRRQEFGAAATTRTRSRRSASPRRELARQGIEAAIEHGLSNARIEQINTQLRLITRRAYGFRTPEALIALAVLSLGGLCPALPR